MIESNDSMKRLTLDIENFPNVGAWWGVRDINVGDNQVSQWNQMACVAAKWHDNPEVAFFSIFEDGQQGMRKGIYDLVEQADVVIHYNGKRHDMPHLRREWMLGGFPEAKEPKEIDLYTVAKRFKFERYTLKHVLAQLGLQNKIENEGFGLWFQCMSGDLSAWKKMREYNINDVIVTEKLYDYWNEKGWIKNHPNAQLYTGNAETCPNPDCLSGPGKWVKRGPVARGNLSIFQSYQCKNCGKRFTGKTPIFRAEERAV